MCTCHAQDLAASKHTKRRPGPRRNVGQRPSQALRSRVSHRQSSTVDHPGISGWFGYTDPRCGDFPQEAYFFQSFPPCGLPFYDCILELLLLILSNSKPCIVVLGSHASSAVSHISKGKQKKSEEVHPNVICFMARRASSCLVGVAQAKVHDLDVLLLI